jgi:GNAT superfamily N-acetyltransferase
MTVEDAGAVALLADSTIGVGYYTEAAVLEYLARSTTSAGVFSFVAEAGGRLVGFRFALPPGRWDSGRGEGLSPSRWPAPLDAAAYLQSAFVDPAFTGLGVGRRMTRQAIDALRGAGARVVVAHSWKESPHNSSFRYLSRLGFVPVAEYPRYWREVDYECSLDGRPCQCTAVEMVLDLRSRDPGAPATSR